LSRTQAILRVLARGDHEKVAASVMRVFGATSIEECIATYEAVGNGERKSLDEFVERVAGELMPPLRSE
jgi:hypothetical protein